MFWGAGHKVGARYVPQITDKKQKPHSKFKKGEQPRLPLGGRVLGEPCGPTISPKPASVPAEGRWDPAGAGQPSSPGRPSSLLLAQVLLILVTS